MASTGRCSGGGNKAGNRGGRGSCGRYLGSWGLWRERGGAATGGAEGRWLAPAPGRGMDGSVPAHLVAHRAGRGSSSPRARLRPAAGPGPGPGPRRQSGQRQPTLDSAILAGHRPGPKGEGHRGGEESESGELSADWLEGWRQRDGAAGHVTPGGSRPWGPSGREAGPGPGRAPPPRSPLPASSAGGRAPPRSSGPRGRFPLSSAVLRPTGRRRRSLGGSRPCPGLPVPFPGP